MQRILKVGVICGGPSLERGISLNSARSVLDHLSGDQIEIVPFYLDQEKNAYAVSTDQLYSNTPSDFDFKLHSTAKALTEKQFVQALKKTDIVFPVIHGPYGEDGGIQTFFEKNNIPYIGSDAKGCKTIFDKFIANETIREWGFFSPPSIVLKIYHNDHKKIVKDFFAKYGIRRAVVKPATGGSSIGVFSVGTVEEALEKVELLFSKRMDTRVVIEPFAEGQEFTVIVLQNKFGLPVAILPTEIEADYTKHQIFDFRKKYLPTRAVRYHCPPRFSNDTVERIQIQAEQLFAKFGLRDFARFDGWVMDGGGEEAKIQKSKNPKSQMDHDTNFQLPTPNRESQIWFSDFNPISGMEQNSFLFQQSARIGMTHGDVLRHVVRNACERYGIEMPVASSQLTVDSRVRGKSSSHQVIKSSSGTSDSLSFANRQLLPVLFGGDTSERQVSLMSGTNVYLKLLKSKEYVPVPYLLDFDGNVWKLPYAYLLNHTVEEIIENCKKAQQDYERLDFLLKRVRRKLGLMGWNYELPYRMRLTELLDSTKMLFIALHGGIGEDGILQRMCEERKIVFNGSSSQVSELCMNKQVTTEFIDTAKIPGISTIRGREFSVAELDALPEKKIMKLWDDLQAQLESKILLVKPTFDGCSTGIVCLHNSTELRTYLYFLMSGQLVIPRGTFRDQTEMIEMPLHVPESIILQEFIETDIIRVKGNELKHTPKTEWIEVTVGLLEKDGIKPPASGHLLSKRGVHVFSPSLTVAEGSVLSVEEKFQGGTGINITPPPEQIISVKLVNKARTAIETLAKKIGLQGYARIDCFLQTKTGEVKVIEVNTLPALTPSTVLYHQALNEKPKIFPVELLERIIENAK